ncbi:MAG: HEPN domain-containing protein [Acidianus infernus]|nr:HEPN domain-containing protein [Acidianus infernus]
MISAKQTLESARSDLNSGFYNWACFKSQQAAEFTVYGIG